MTELYRWTRKQKRLAGIGGGELPAPVREGELEAEPAELKELASSEK